MTQFQFSRLRLVLLLADNIVFGGCVALLLLGKSSFTLIALTIFTFGLLVMMVSRGYVRVRSSDPP